MNEINGHNHARAGVARRRELMHAFPADEPIQIHRPQPPAFGAFEAHSNRLLEPRPQISEIEQGVTVTFVDHPSISGEIEAFSPHKTRAKVRSGSAPQEGQAAYLGGSSCPR